MTESPAADDMTAEAPQPDSAGAQAEALPVAAANAPERAPAPPQARAQSTDDVVSILRRLQALVRNLEGRILAGEQAPSGSAMLAEEVARRDRHIRELTQRLQRLETEVMTSERARGALEERISYQLQLIEDRLPFWNRGRKAGPRSRGR